MVRTVAAVSQRERRSSEYIPFMSSKDLRNSAPNFSESVSGHDLLECIEK